MNKLKTKLKQLALAAFAAVLVPVMSLTAYADDPVKYLDEDGTEKSITSYTVVSDYYDNIDCITWNEGWYVVKGNVTINVELQNKAVEITDDVRLILCDGAKLTVLTDERDAISITSGSLTIYAQSTGNQMGALDTKGGNQGNGITGVENVNITINGGNINSHGGDCGIFADEGSNIKINGGNVSATGDYYCGIVSYGDITIAGGNVIAAGEQTYGYGITTEKEIIIKGGSVTATGSSGISGTVKNAIAGTGWTDVAGTQGEEEIAVSQDGQDI